ncbi:hypothetical protein [Methylobacterium sp. E-045]|uniref:hypothetical protein n=1 Tax=Methylobacterium sp. E-045 TaxID=2836575 RepID=UPI001FB8C945|nr:hypothetical protein [Methylobacterium sp. E-045]MCJ2132196.1 hypothetical protein [Methylobacterium sp. E-045]
MNVPPPDLRRRVARFFRERPRLHAAAHPPYLYLRRLLRRRELGRHGTVRDARGGNAILRAAILSGAPHGIAKIGSLEAEALTCFLGQSGYSPLLMEQLVTNVGLFPGTSDSIDRFCASYLAALEHIDLLAVWGQPGEAEILSRAPAAFTASPRELLHIDSFEPWYHDAPWSGALAGKRVVVLHPFAATMERQYARRREIWGDRGILPDCELRTVRMPLSPALVPSMFGHWQDQFDHLVGEIESRPYDVVIAGAGGISLLVAARACAQGKVGFHMGGLTQILFGILGRRWDKSAFIMAQRNAAWVRPSGEEAPATTRKVEQGCYW